jgi:hypothetical protein
VPAQYTAVRVKIRSMPLLSNVRKMIIVIIKLAAGFLLLLFVAIMVFGWWASKGTFSISKFDPVIWHAKQTNETEAGCYRGGMAYDIRERILEPGMSKNKVSSILGEPDSSGDSEFQYILGICSGFRIDYDVLHVYFKEGNLVNAAVYQH